MMAVLRGNRDVSLVLLGANSLGVLLAAQEHLWGTAAALGLAALACLLLTLRRGRRRADLGDGATHALAVRVTNGGSVDVYIDGVAIERALTRLKRRRGGKPLDFED